MKTVLLGLTAATALLGSMLAVPAQATTPEPTTTVVLTDRTGDVTGPNKSVDVTRVAYTTRFVNYTHPNRADRGRSLVINVHYAQAQRGQVATTFFTVDGFRYAVRQQSTKVELFNALDGTRLDVPWTHATYRPADGTGLLRAVVPISAFDESGAAGLPTVAKRLATMVSVEGKGDSVSYDAVGPSSKRLNLRPNAA